MLERAYSQLTLKAVDEARRMFSGVATTPTTDRMGDVVEPLGVSFKNPLPLLLYHDARAPVGTVRFDPPTKAGITFTAQIASVAEPGRLKDRVDEAWQSIQARIVRGVSIGFRVVNNAMDFMQDTGGVRYRETEVLELSLVAIPANQDATISTIKSCDVGRPAAPGTASGVVAHLPAPRGSSNGSRTMNVSERLTAALAARTTKSARLEELLNVAADTVPSDTDRTERTTLTKEVGDLNGEIESLKALEAAQREKASPIASPQAPGSKPTHTVTVESPLPKGIEFARYAMCLMATKGNRADALALARQHYPDYPRIQALLKTAVTPHTSADGANTGGQELVYATTLASEFVEYLRPKTIIGQFGNGNIPSLRRVPFNVRLVGQTSGGTAAWVGQGIQKPVTKFDFNATALTWAKVAAITVLSEELARFSNPSAEGMLRDALADCLLARLDTDFVAPTKVAVSNVSPASITYGLSAGTPSGTDAAAVRADINTALTTFIDASIDPTNLVIITSNAVALTLSLMRNALGQREFPDITMRGGMLEGFPVIASQYCTHGSPLSHMLIFANASDIFLADDGGVSVDASREASIEMETDPANQSGTVVSLWQANLLALRAERYVNWSKRRAAAVYYFDAVAYAAGSPA